MSSDNATPNNQVTTEYTLATAAKDDADGLQVQGQPIRNGFKQGHKCCGGCCDMRRAVIIVNIINCTFLLLAIMSLAAIKGADPDNYTDDEVSKALADVDGESVGAVIAISVIKLAINALGIYGALQYNIIMVGLSCAVYCIDFFFALLAVNIFGLLYAGFFAYPHFFYIKEVKAGTMTPENYPINERQSCCCV